MGHCVGRMNYDRRFVREESLIFFVRTKEQPDIPFVTLEYSLRNHKVLQCYGEHDHKPSEDILQLRQQSLAAVCQQTLETNSKRGLTGKGDHYGKLFQDYCVSPAERYLRRIRQQRTIEKLWQFSAFLVGKGFKIAEVGSEDKFLDGDLPKPEESSDKILLRACAKGCPVRNGNRIEVNGKSYEVTK